MVQKFLSILRNISFVVRRRYLATAAESEIAAQFRARNHLRRSKEGAPLIAMQCMEEPFYFCLFGEIITALRNQGPIRTEQYILRSLRFGVSQSLGDFLSAFFYWNRFSDWKLIRLYSSFCDRVAYNSTGLLSPIRSVRLTLDAVRLWRGLRTTEDVLNLAVDGIAMGDLVIDSYLRFKPSVTVDLNDLYLLVIIRQMLKSVALARHYFSAKRPSLYLTSYTSYIQHGIPARVAASLGIRVLAFGNYQEVATEITTDNFFHSKPSQDYAAEFLRLPDQQEKLETARRQLSTRLSGEIDPTTSYMKQSAYEIRSTDVPDVAGAAVVFLHDFFDSPHCYRWMIFHDFWEWTSVTMEILEESGLPFFIKPHPNQIAGSKAYIERLQRKHPRLRVIPSEITNKQLADAGMQCAITVYGTVASEMAFLGIPSISCGDSPHASFEFSRTARSRDEYHDFLRGFQNHHPDPNLLKKQACIFFYMHNLNLDPQAIAFRDELIYVRTRMTEITPPKKEDVKEIVAMYRKLSESAGFKHFATELYHQLRLHKTTATHGESQGSIECSQMPQY